MPSSPAIFIGRRFFSSGHHSRLSSFIAMLAMAGLVLGVALLIIVLSVMNGFDREMRERILVLVPHIQIFDEQGIADWRTVKHQIERVKGVKEATPFTSFEAMLNARGKVRPVRVQGLLPGAIDSQLQAFLPEQLPQWLANDGLVISRQLAQKLGVSVGDDITLMVPRHERGRQLAPAIRLFNLTGIVDSHTAEDKNLALVALDTAGTLTGLNQHPQGLRVTVEDVFEARTLGYRLLGELTPGFSFIDWLQTHGNLYQAIQMSRQMVGLLVFLIIAIAVFNVVSMLVMTVVDKRPEVAILKTLGSTNSAILGIFIVQGTLIGLMGCAAGLVLGVLGANYISEITAWLEQLLGLRFLNAEVYPIDYLPSQLLMRDVVVVIATALILNFVATLYPAWLAARVRPAEILRYE